MRLAKLLVLSFVLFGTTLSAQDIHFSQFYMAPLDLNPAMTGVMNCNIRVTANYRNQWASVIRSNAYNTYSVSYDQKIPVGRNDYFGAGALFWGDRAGSLGLGIMQGRLSGSYAKKMGGFRKRSHYLAFGAEVGFGQRRVDFTNAQFGAQHNGNGEYDPTLSPEENALLASSNSRTYFDASAGLLWFSVLDENTNFFVGAAYHHLNRANIAFTNGTSTPLYSKITVHGGGEFLVSDRMGLIPGMIMRFQGKSMEIIPGTSVKYIFGKSRRSQQALQLGAWYRMSNSSEGAITSDAVILSTKFDYNEFTLGFSYDLNVSSLKTASNSNGAYEFALQYKICGPERRNVYCPNF